MEEIPAFDNRVQIDKLRLAGGVFALLGMAAFAFIGLTGYGMGVIGLLFGFICLIGAGYAFIGLGKAPCPECGYMVSGVGMKRSGSVQCKGCGDYFRIHDGATVATAKDAVESFPAFATACPQQIEWPGGCCVCRGAVTRHVPIKLELKEDSPVAKDMLTRAATLGTCKLVSVRTFEVELPVCDEHGSESAELEYRYNEEQLYISFRSRQYAEVFDQANGPVFWGS